MRRPSEVGVWSGGYADLFDSYEGLPPDYTLGHNMLAGAFAGIAVRFFAHDHKCISRLISVQEHSVMYPVDLLKVRAAMELRWSWAEDADAECRHGCKS